MITLLAENDSISLVVYLLFFAFLVWCGRRQRFWPVAVLGVCTATLAYLLALYCRAATGLSPELHVATGAFFLSAATAVMCAISMRTMIRQQKMDEYIRSIKHRNIGD